MDKEEKPPSRISLEIFTRDDKGKETSAVYLEYRPPHGGGDGNAVFKAATNNEEAVKAAVEQAAGIMIGVARGMPPGVISEATPDNEWVLEKMPAGEGADYVRNELPYGEHMVMLNAKMERLPDGHVKSISGSPHIFRKIKPATSPGDPAYKILRGGKWLQIRDIDEYVEKHKLIVHKLNVDG